MLLTIHNLPITTRYQDVKSLLHEKCGLTDIIVDNLVSEGKSAKVTVGLANEDDGAFVVRKLNGLFINGQQLYIEHKRRNTTSHEQPYRPSVDFMQESRGFEQAHINNMIETAVAPNAPNWNQNVTAPYMSHMPTEQNVAYSSYAGVPQTPHYIEPRPVAAENDRGYSGFQDDKYIPAVASSGSVHQAPRDWGRNGMEQHSDAFRHNDRKRMHSPERPPAPKLSRKETSIPARSRRHEAVRAEPPRQWSEQGPPNHGSRPPFRQPEQFPRKQHQNVDDRYQPREPSPDYRHTEPQWERKRWDEPKPNPRSEREREWGNDDHGNWERQPVKVWDNPPEQQWQDEPRRWDSAPKSQWEGNYSSMHVEDNRPDCYDRREPVSPPHERNVQESYSRNQGQYRQPVPRKSRYDQWNSEPVNRSVSRPVVSSNRQGRPVEEMQRRDRTRPKNGRQEREWGNERPNASRDRSGAPTKSEFGRQGQGLKDYPKSKGPRPAPEFNRRVAPKEQPRPAMPKHERHEMYRRKPVVNEENYPPRKPENKPQTLRALINKDHSNRGQAASLIAKTVIGLPKGSNTYIPSSPVESFIFKQLKKCVRSRIDVELGEELSSDVSDAVRKYRIKYPINQDKTLLKQIREKATKEYEEMKEKKSQTEATDKVRNEIEVKKEEPEIEINSQKEDILNQARVEVENEIKEHKETPDDKKADEFKKPGSVPLGLVAPNMRNIKPGQRLTNRQKVKQMKLLRKWEYDQDDLYSLDEVSYKALDDEMAELEKLFTDECSNPEDKEEGAICKRITTDSLNEFHKSIRLYITKRILNVPTGLAIRVFSQGKLPRKTAIKEYLNQYRIERMTLMKSVKGKMFTVNLSRFQDFDKLCHIEHDVIDGIPVTFKALHLVGPAQKISKNQVKAMRDRLIQGQIDPNIDLAEFEDTADYGAEGTGKEIEDKQDFQEKEAFEDFTEDVDAGALESNELVTDPADAEDFEDNINIGNINEEDLEDF